jgi:predicted kinase
MPIAYILVGVPASGKSSWIATLPVDWNKTVIASTDNYIERTAKSQGKTYNDVFHAHMPHAIKHMANSVVNAVKNKNDIIWDQTSTTVGARAKKLRMLSSDYKKIAVVFLTPNEKEHQRRLASRPGKHIPAEVLVKMQADFVMPTTAEGFDEIRVINPDL